MGKSGETAGPAGPGCGDGSGATGSGMLAVTLPGGGLGLPRAGRPPPRRNVTLAATRDPGRRMERRAGRSARRRRRGSFRGSQEAGVAVGPPG